MRRLPPPKDQNGQPLTAGDVFETCISRVKNKALKTRLQAIRQEVEDCAEAYDIRAEAAELYNTQAHNQVGGVSQKEMVKVYDDRMVPEKSPGRYIYDKIKLAPPHRRCPLCGIGTVTTLDHFLPKAHFPNLTVTPNNLVPACDWCQGEKWEYYADTKGGQLLHPYFDDYENELWLRAEVIVGVPAAFRYFSLPPANWEEWKKERVATHLRKLNLSQLFTSNAGSRLSEIRARLERLYRQGGDVAVRSHLQEDLLSAEAENINSWPAAMFRAAIESDWFCDGGFLHT